MFVAADGRQFSPSVNVPFLSGSDVQPGATATSFVAFGQAPLGGTYTFVGFTDDFLTEVGVDMAVPA